MPLGSDPSPAQRTVGRGLRAGVIALAAGALALAPLASQQAAAVPQAAPKTTISVGPVGTYPFPTDTPAAPFIDKDGQFYFQQSAALYGADDPRYWEFYTGTDFDDAQRSGTISDAVNPANSKDRNNDTTWRCNTSPTGKKSTYPPSGSGYSQKNYCDLLGTWVDPDTGDWIGLVHNEFTPEPFPYGGFSHYDAIDYAKSTDQGRTWKIEGHAITSPYSTKRGDNKAFPNDTWDYGDGDPRLFVDTKSGYFYVYYGSRIEPKTAAGGEITSLSHVARAPISKKMATGSWSKFYDGGWRQPGVGGLESNLEPVSSTAPDGYTPVGHDYNPKNTGTTDEQMAAGLLPTKSPLLVMNITYSAHLGMYLGEPEVINQDTPASQQIYATKSLTSQKWTLLGDTGDYKSGSWYRWIVDGVNHTNPYLVGKTFRSYCSINCAEYDGEYVDITTNAKAAKPVTTGRALQLVNRDGQALTARADGSVRSVASATQAKASRWTFASTGDGAFTIKNAASGAVLGVDSDTPAARAWGTKPRTSELNSDGPTVGQQWFVIGDATKLRLVNRYSGLVLGMSETASRSAETTPLRTWTAPATGVGSGRTANQQTLHLVGR